MIFGDSKGAYSPCRYGAQQPKAVGDGNEPRFQKRRPGLGTLFVILGA